jgi:hypothetical protein
MLRRGTVPTVRLLAATAGERDYAAWAGWAATRGQ